MTKCRSKHEWIPLFVSDSSVVSCSIEDITLCSYLCSVEIYVLPFTTLWALDAFLVSQKDFSSHSSSRRNIFLGFLYQVSLSCARLSIVPEISSRFYLKMFWISFQTPWKAKWSQLKLSIHCRRIMWRWLSWRWSTFNPCKTFQQTLWCSTNFAAKTFSQILSYWLWKSNVGNCGWVHIACWCFLVSTERKC